MSLEHVAKHLASKGRKFPHGAEDTELVHMTKGEVAGLQQLAMAHGGSLTINPDTGLPEAGILSKLLPTLLGVGAMFIPGMQPLGAAAIGAATGAVTNKENPLMGAVMGGLGGYGGAGLAEGVMGAGAAAAPSAAGVGGYTGAVAPSAVPTADIISKAGAMERLGMAGEGLKQLATPQSGAWGNLIGSAADTKAGVDASGLGGYMGAAKTAGMAAAPMMMYTPEAPRSKDEEEEKLPKYRYDRGYTGGVYAPGSAYTSQATYFNPSYTRMAAAGGEIGYAEGGNTGESASALSYLSGNTGESADAMNYLMGRAPRSAPAPAPTQQGVYTSPSANSQPGYDSAIGSLFGALQNGLSGGRPAYSYDSATGQFTKLAPPAPPPAPEPSYSYNPTDYGGFAEGGITSLSAGGFDFTQGSSPSYDDNRARSFAAGGGLEAGGFVIPADVVSAMGNGSSSAGLEHLASKYGAKPIKGPGDGMSDSIKTHIDGKQKAAVARDEAYMGPKEVARAGGAKKLYAMMDRVRKAAHGKTSQQRKVNPDAVA